MTQNELLYYINDKFNLSVESTDADQFCCHDANNIKYVVELKCRTAHYDDQFIEKNKCESNHEERDFLYIVSTPRGVYGWDITKLVNEGYDFQWETRSLPATTTFSNRQFIDKEVGYLHIDNAHWRGNYDFID